VPSTILPTLRLKKPGLYGFRGGPAAAPGTAPGVGAVGGGIGALGLVLSGRARSRWRAALTTGACRWEAAGAAACTRRVLFCVRVGGRREG